MNHLECTKSKQILACFRQSDSGERVKLQASSAKRNTRAKKARGIFRPRPTNFSPAPHHLNGWIFPSSIFWPHPTNFSPTPYNLNAWKRLRKFLQQKRICPRGERKLPTNRLLGMGRCAGQHETSVAFSRKLLDRGYIFLTWPLLKISRTHAHQFKHTSWQS